MGPILCIISITINGGVVHWKFMVLLTSFNVPEYTGTAEMLASEIKKSVIKMICIERKENQPKQQQHSNYQND